MSLRVIQHEIRILQLPTRMPFRYGIATMAEFPLLFLRLEVEIDGQRVSGVSSDLLPPKWFTKEPDKDPKLEIEEMLEVILSAAVAVQKMRAESVFDLWRQLYECQHAWGAQQALAPLLVHFGTSLVERAIIDAFCLVRGRSFAQLVQANEFAIDLGEVHTELLGLEPGNLLPEVPLRRIVARHTIGLGDPLTRPEVKESERLDDGLPQALSECIERYGLRHFKIKVCGQPEVDIPRLGRILATLDEAGVKDGQFSLDGNEQFSTLADLEAFWAELERQEWFERFISGLLFVEQPLHREVALSVDLGELSSPVLKQQQIIIDESDADTRALPRALSLGYQGTSHKNCKGVFKGIANRCLLEKRRREAGGDRLLMSGEDLCNQGPVGLQQDLAVMACLGIESVERNGHHYCQGLAGLPRSIQEQVLVRQADLYQRTAEGWPTLAVAQGELLLESVNQSPFGVGFRLALDELPSLEDWRKANN